VDTKAIIAELEEERERLDRAIQALQTGRVGRRRRRGRLSAAARQRISEGMKRRWAQRKRKEKAS
jgi:exonuclease VII small subunit